MFWGLSLCSLVVIYRRFEKPTVLPSGSLNIHQTAGRHNPEDCKYFYCLCGTAPSSGPVAHCLCGTGPSSGPVAHCVELQHLLVLFRCEISTVNSPNVDYFCEFVASNCRIVQSVSETAAYNGPVVHFLCRSACSNGPVFQCLFKI